MEDNIISIGSKQFDLNQMSDEQVIRLFTEIKERELQLYEKIAQIESQLNYVEDVN